VWFAIYLLLLILFMLCLFFYLCNFGTIYDVIFLFNFPWMIHVMVVICVRGRQSTDDEVAILS
jgi:hypothetical protein